MEFPFRSRPTTAAADDEENGCLRRFPEPPPSQPHGHGDANTAGVDTTLLMRRQELMLELHKGFMHQDMILRELAETERVMGLTARSHNPVPAVPWSQDYWHCRTPSVPPWEAPLHQPCPCGCATSPAVREPPLYPHVERSPSPAPLLQLHSASDTEKQQDSRSSGARTHSTSGGHVELCTSPSKCAPEEETLVPVATNASVRSMRSGSIHEGASTHQRPDDSWERQCGAEACHGVPHMYEGRNRKSEEREAIKFAKDDQSDEAMQLPYRYSLAGNENAGSYQQKQLEFSEHAPGQTRPGNDADQHQEGTPSGLRTHPFSRYGELCRSPSKQTQVEETLVPVAAKTSINQMPSASFCDEAVSGHQQAVVGIKVDVGDGRSRQPLHEIKNQSSEKGKAIDSAIKDSIKKPVQQRLQYNLTDQDNAANSEQKNKEFNEPTPEGTSAGLKRKLTAPSSPVKKQKPLGQWSCTVCHANPANQHQLEAHLAGKRHQLNVAALQTSRSKSNIHERNTKPMPARSRVITTNTHQDGKEVPENTWTCTLCQAKCTTESDYYVHLGGRRHHENVEARRVKLSRSYCTVCDVQCSSEKNLASHLDGRRHREALESRN